MFWKDATILCEFDTFRNMNIYVLVLYTALQCQKNDHDTTYANYSRSERLELNVQEHKDIAWD
jgi:hypothetical protein